METLLIHSFNPRTRIGCDVIEDAGFCCCVVSIRAPAKGAIGGKRSVRAPSRVSIRAPAKGAIRVTDGVRIDGAVSIRAPAKGAMATHSKIRPFRALTTTLTPQNRRNFWNPFPLTHPCASPLREKTCRFYDHLGFALEFSFGFFRYSCVAVVKFSIAPRQTIFFWSTPQPNQATARPC